MADFVNAVERAYFVRKAGGAAPNVPFNNIKRAYINGFIGGGNARTSIKELEKRFLMKIISDAGGTVSNARSVENLYRQAVSAIGKIPAKNVNDNRIIFYRNAP